MMLPENTTGSYEHGRKWLGVIPDIKKSVVFVSIVFKFSFVYNYVGQKVYGTCLKVPYMYSSREMTVKISTSTFI